MFHDREGGLMGSNRRSSSETLDDPLRLRRRPQEAHAVEHLPLASRLLPLPSLQSTPPLPTSVELLSTGQGKQRPKLESRLARGFDGELPSIDILFPIIQAYTAN